MNVRCFSPRKPLTVKYQTLFIALIVRLCMIKIMTGKHQSSLKDLYPARWDIPLLIITSAVLLVIGLSKPIITVRKLWNSNTLSIMSGIANLWHSKDQFLAAVIFFFSIVFPIVKLTCLFLIWFMRMKDEHRKHLILGLEILGRWSMLDVFVSAVIIVSVKLGALASARIEAGIYYFSASIFMAMLVASMQGHLARKIAS